MNTLDLMLKLWPVIAGIVGLIAVVSVAFYRLNEHEKMLKRFADIESFLRNTFKERDKSARDRLYHRDGESIFVPRSTCDRCRAECAAQISEKMGAITTMLSDHTKSVMEMMGFMGRVDEFLRQGRREP